MAGEFAKIRSAEGSLTRREWLRLGAAGVLGCSLIRTSWAGPSEVAPLRVLFYTDVHAGLNDSVAEPLGLAARAMREVDADVVVCGGDAIHGGHVSTEAECAPRFAQYRDFLKNLGRPVQHVIGNHDLAGAAPKSGAGAAKDPRAMARRELGIAEDYRTFDVGGYRFVVLDSVELTGGDKVYRGFVGAEQLEWLRGVVEDSERDQVFVLATHIPFRTTFLQRKEGPGAGLPENLVVANANEVLTVFEGRRLPVLLQGHLHSNEVIDWAGRRFVMGGAISGGWWRGPNLETSFGFGVLEIADGRIDWEYRSYGWPA